MLHAAPLRKVTELRHLLFRFTTQAKCNGKPRELLSRTEYGRLKELLGELDDVQYIVDIIEHVEAEDGVEYLLGDKVKCRPGPSFIWRRLLDSIAAAAPAYCIQGDLAEMVSLLEEFLSTDDASSNEGLRQRLKRKLPLFVAVLEETESSSIPDWLVGYTKALKLKAERVQEIITQVTAGDEAVDGADDREPVSHALGGIPWIRCSGAWVIGHKLIGVLKTIFAHDLSLCVFRHSPR